MNGCLERRAHGYRWKACVGGKRVNIATRITDRREAERWAKAKYDELVRQHSRVAAGLRGPARDPEFCCTVESPLVRLKELVAVVARDVR